MGIDLWDQALTFAGAAILGMGAGLVYDLMRVLRRRLRLPLLGPVLDFLFWLLLTAALFVYAVATGGRLRIFMVIAVGLGAPRPLSRGPAGRRDRLSLPSGRPAHDLAGPSV